MDELLFSPQNGSSRSQGAVSTWYSTRMDKVLATGTQVAWAPQGGKPGRGSPDREPATMWSGEGSEAVTLGV